MRREITYLAILGLAACAHDAALEPPYDEVARVVANDVAAAPDGGDVAILADIVRIARGGGPVGQPDFMPLDRGFVYGRHGGLLYSYSVKCRNELGKRIRCGEWVDSAEAVVLWGGAVNSEELIAQASSVSAWTLTGLSTSQGWASGWRLSVYEVEEVPRVEGSGGQQVSTHAEAALVVGYDRGEVLGGAIEATVDVAVREPAQGVASEVYVLAPVVTFEAPGWARIELDPAHVFALDTGSGEVWIDAVLE